MLITFQQYLAYKYIIMYICTITKTKKVFIMKNSTITASSIDELEKGTIFTVRGFNNKFKHLEDGDCIDVKTKKSIHFALYAEVFVDSKDNRAPEEVENYLTRVSEINITNGFWDLDKTGLISAPYQVKSKNNEICLINQQDDNEQSLRNAKLIKNSKNLLVALSSLVDRCEDDSTTEEQRIQTMKMCTNLIESIIK